MKSIMFFLSALLLVSCIATHRSYEKQMEDYRKQTMEDFKKNERLDFTDAELKALDFYPIDEHYNCRCTFEKMQEPKGIEMATYSGKVKQFSIYGTAQCEIMDKTIAVEVYRYLSPGIPKDYLFLPIKDLTNGETTYGGGRYIELKTGDIKNGNVQLDFNKLYNPYCAYKDGFNCPVPPAANHINIALPVGEKNFLKRKE